MAQKIALLTLPLSTNYGGMIQAVALYNFLAQNGKSVTLLRKKVNRPLWQRLTVGLLQTLPGQNIGGIRGRFLRRTIHRSFMQKWMPSQSREIATQEGLRKAVTPKSFDAVVVGSDQVWRRAYVPDAEYTNFFLDFVPDGVRRVSYAASFGRPSWQEHDFTDRIRSLLARFDRVAVREASGVDICREAFGRHDAELVLDPTLLMPASFYTQMAAPREATQSGKRLMKYVLDPVPALPALETEILTSLGAGAVSGGIQLDHGDGLPPTIPEWLRGFRDADFVLTDSFHGMAFAIIFRKQFLALVNTDRGADRFTSLAAQLGLEDRLVFADQTEMRLPVTPIDYDAVAQRHETRAAESVSLLLAGLEGKSA